LRIGVERFAISGPDRYTKLAQTPSSPKIFLLPNFETQSPRNVADVVNAQAARFHIERLRFASRFKKSLRHNCNCDFPQRIIGASDDPCDEVRAHSQCDPSNALSMASASSVNTSLSSAVSFSFCWCNRNAVQVDSRLAHFDRAISLTGGQHGEEGEESEEDGEEGSQEEEVQEEVRSRRRQLPTEQVGVVTRSLMVLCACERS
jgi:hypothetical protein